MASSLVTKIGQLINLHKKINDYLFYKWDLNGGNFMKPKDWTLENGSLKVDVFQVDSLHLTKDGNVNVNSQCHQIEL